MKETATPQAWLTTANVLWIVLYLCTMGAVVLGLHTAREQALANFSSADAQSEWDEFRSDMKKISEDPDAPVARRVPKSEEPPTLRLLRDYYGTCVLLALLLCSALFATLMVMVRGVFGQSQFIPRND